MALLVDKSVDARIWGVTTQNSSVRITSGDSTGGTFTARKNPLRGSLMWDQCVYVVHNLAVAGAATGGSYTVTVETDAVSGYTALPIARLSDLGPNSVSTQVLTNLHQVGCSPLPTHLNIVQDATGGGITLTVDVLAKQYRGFMGSGPINTSERVIQGTLLRGASYTGGYFVSGAGFTADETVTLGTSSSNMGLGRMRLWDHAMFWAVSGESASGTHDVSIIATVRGTTVNIATTGTGGAIGATGGFKTEIANQFYGPIPTPTQVIWDVTTGGVSDARIVVLAKSGRGSMGKR